MKPDFSNLFEIHELHNYIFAKLKRPELEEAFEDLEEALYDDIPMSSTCYDYELGRVFMGSGGSLEDFVIKMIDRKDSFLKLLNKIRKQEELFDIAMDSLTPREKDVIQVHYFNRDNDLGLSLDFFKEILIEAQSKLCSFIGDERQKEREEAEKQRIQLNMKAINEWKRGREVS